MRKFISAFILHAAALPGLIFSPSLGAEKAAKPGPFLEGNCQWGACGGEIKNTALLHLGMSRGQGRLLPALKFFSRSLAGWAAKHAREKEGRAEPAALPYKGHSKEKPPRLNEARGPRAGAFILGEPPNTPIFSLQKTPLKNL